MNEQDRTGFYELWGGVQETYNRQASVMVLEIAFNALKAALSLAEVQQGISKHTQDPKSGMYPPTPAHIISQMKAAPEDDALLWWSAVLRAVRGGPWNYVVFDDPAVHKVVSDMGGLQQLGRTNEAELRFAEKRFIQLYLAVKKLPGQFKYPPKLRANNYTHLQQEQETLYIGDPEKCAQVEHGPALAAPEAIKQLTG